MLKPYKDQYGYKKLLAYKKAEDLQIECSRLTRLFPFSKTLSSLADQMDRSARSGKQNIVEGWKRNTTKEYYDFLGFSIGAVAELEEDCDDIIRGVYPELMGKMGLKREEGDKGELFLNSHLTPFSSNLQTPSSPLNSRPKTPLVPFSWILSEVEKLRFYPLDDSLPSIIQLKLRAKELNFLLKKLQDSLLEKMERENNLSLKDKAKIIEKKKLESKSIEEKIMQENGLIRLEDGKFIPKEVYKRIRENN